MTKNDSVTIVVGEGVSGNIQVKDIAFDKERGIQIRPFVIPQVAEQVVFYDGVAVGNKQSWKETVKSRWFIPIGYHAVLNAQAVVCEPSDIDHISWCVSPCISCISHHHVPQIP